MNTNTILLLAAAAAAIWYFMKGQASTTAAASTGASEPVVQPITTGGSTLPGAAYAGAPTTLYSTLQTIVGNAQYTPDTWSFYLRQALSLMSAVPSTWNPPGCAMLFSGSPGSSDPRCSTPLDIEPYLAIVIPYLQTLGINVPFGGSVLHTYAGDIFVPNAGSQTATGSAGGSPALQTLYAQLAASPQAHDPATTGTTWAQLATVLTGTPVPIDLAPGQQYGMTLPDWWLFYLQWLQSPNAVPRTANELAGLSGVWAV